jgi:hypothetical protein
VEGLDQERWFSNVSYLTNVQSIKPGLKDPKEMVQQIIKAKEG